MPSQEDYLDNLLKDMSGNSAQQEEFASGTDMGVHEADVGAFDMDMPVLDSGYEGSDMDMPVLDSGYEGSDIDMPVLDSGYEGSDMDMPVLDSGYEGSDMDMPVLDSGYEGSDMDMPVSDSGYEGSDMDMPVSDSGYEGSDMNMPVLDSGYEGSDLDIPASDLDYEVPPEDVSAPDLDAVTQMSENEIEKLLSAGAEQGQEQDLTSASDMDIADEDVLKMLEESDDEELQDIQELLQKADNNEAVDDSITALLEDYPEEDLEAKILGGGQEVSDKEEKKRLAREKKELAKAQKAKKKEEAAAKKAAKKAEKEAAKAEKAAKSKDGKTEKQREEIADEEIQEEDLFDASLLDSIVSEADRTGKKQGAAEPQEPAEQDTETAEPAEAKEDSANETSDISDFEGLDSGVDFDSLFGGEGGDPEIGGDADFPDFLADEADAALKNIEKQEEDGDGAPKQKQGFFAKIMNLLTEEEEEENENIKLSQENQDILDELDKEKKGKKGKKGKKNKKDDDKKIKEKPAKEKKPKKAPKPKKEKPAKKVEAPGKKLSFKKMLPVILVGLSVGVLLFVFVNSVVDFSDKNTAKNAYYEGDYQTCYQNLIGKDLNETESIMFGKSESILYIRLWIREFEMFMEEGDRVHALDSLIQTVEDYPGLYEYAGQWNAEPDIAAGYAIILNFLNGEFGLTEAQALEIAAVRSDVEYTRMVTAIAGGKTFENWNAPDVPQIPDGGTGEQIPDMLPEEEDLGGGEFIENQ